MKLNKDITSSVYVVYQNKVLLHRHKKYNTLLDKVNPQKGESKELFWFSKEEIENNDTIKPHVKVMALDALRILKEE